MLSDCTLFIAQINVFCILAAIEDEMLLIQMETLDRQMFLSKELYNLLLENSKVYYENTKKMLTEYKMNIWITQLKKERPEFAELHSQVLQNVSKRISDAYGHFFKRCKEKKKGKKVKVGFPRYKNFVSSLTYPQTKGFKIEKKKVELSKIGGINFVNHREIEGKVKTCTIKKTKSQKWNITISVEKNDKPFKSNNKEKVGIDLGINKYATLSNGEILQNKRITKMSMDRDLNASINILRLGIKKYLTTSGQGESHASGDIIRPQLQEADVAERGTILGVFNQKAPLEAPR